MVQSSALTSDMARCQASSASSRHHVPRHKSRWEAMGRGPMIIRMAGRMRVSLWGVVVLGIARIRAMRENRRERLLGLHAGYERDGDATPEEFERLTGSRRSPTSAPLVAAQESMMGEQTVIPDGALAYTRQGALERGSVDEVRLDGDGLDVDLVVLFRSDDRPGCVFGWRMPIWPTPIPDPEDPYTVPKGWADLLAIELVEFCDAFPGLPACDPDARASPGLGRTLDRVVRTLADRAWGTGWVHASPPGERRRPRP